MDVPAVMNREALLDNVRSNEDRRARVLALDSVEAALGAVDPKKLMKEKVRVKDDLLVVNGCSVDLQNRGVYVVGGGKGSGAMAEAIEEILGDRIIGGVVNVLEGTMKLFKVGIIELNEAGHPIPDDRSLEGTKRMLDLMDESEEDVVICLISGGGSALMTLPKEGVTLKDVKKITDDLLLSGATIKEINTVRKHISNFKGGQLIQRAYPSKVISFILSDVVGDPIDVIASGPTVPDPSTYHDAVETLKRYLLWESCPSSIRMVLEEGVAGKIPETPNKEDILFNKVKNIVIGNNGKALRGAKEYLEMRRIDTLILSSFIEGEARQVGRIFGGIAQEEYSFNNPLNRPAAIVAGGETTVKVVGSGMGGRNQELVLSAAEKISGLRGVVIASIDTDGIDGNTDAAGALADGSTISRAREMGLKFSDLLSNNDSYTYFREIGDHILIGPTTTNVNDLTVLIVL